MILHIKKNENNMKDVSEPLGLGLIVNNGATANANPMTELIYQA